MAFSGISGNTPGLGSVASGVIQSVLIAPAKFNKPYIMGAGVVSITPDSSTKASGASVGAGATILGIASLGGAQIQQRGDFVKEGYDSDYNQVGLRGAFWAALDLANFDATALTGASLYVDANGVFSYAATAPTGATKVTSNVAVLNYCDKAILSAIDETIGTTTFSYASGIGAILLAI